MQLAGKKGFRLSLALCAALIVSAAEAASAQSAAFELDTFKTSIDVKLSLTETSNWNGITEGCYAPQEKFNIAYQMRIDSTPSRRSAVKDGITTLSNLAYGTTNSYGAKRSFNQYSSSAPWELVVQNPASCDTPAPPVPAWASSPTCKKVYNRVDAQLVMTTNTTKGDGSLVLNRVGRPGGTAGGNIGASCFRTLHNIASGHFDTVIGIDASHTFIQLPIPNLETKLKKISRGSSRSRPSFKIKFRVSDSCTDMGVSPSNGQDDSFLASFFTTPHQSLGDHKNDINRSNCKISGNGIAVVRREGRVRSTRLNR